MKITLNEWHLFIYCEQRSEGVGDASSLLLFLLLSHIPLSPQHVLYWVQLLLLSGWQW